MADLLALVSRYWRAAMTLVLLLVVWEAIVQFARVPTWLLPAPSAIGQSMVEWKDLLPRHVWATTYVTLIGFALAGLGGFLISLAVTASPFLFQTLYPILLALQSMPKIAIAPLLLMWVGFGPESKIIIIFLICFFPVVVAAVTGLNAPPAALIDLARSFGTPAWRTYLKIRIPYSIPFLFIGLKVAITLAVTGAVVGEFVAAKEGLGFLILNGVQQFNTPLAFAAMAFLAVLTVVFYGLVALAERLLIRWKAEQG